MRAFIDTSAMAKKYIEEEGVESFDRLWDQVTEVVVSPAYLLEMQSMMARRLREKTLDSKDLMWIKQEIRKDAENFETVAWGHDLVQKALTLMEAHPLTTMDAIQLAGACFIAPDIFITSDKKLFKWASCEMKNAVLVE